MVFVVLIDLDHVASHRLNRMDTTSTLTKLNNILETKI